MRWMRGLIAGAVTLALTGGVASAALASFTPTQPATVQNDASGILVPGVNYGLGLPSSVPPFTAVTGVVVGGVTVPWLESGFFHLPCGFTFHGKTTLAVVNQQGPLTTPTPVTVGTAPLRFRVPSGAVAPGTTLQLTALGHWPMEGVQGTWSSGAPPRIPVATLNGVRLRGRRGRTSISFVLGRLYVHIPADARSGNIVMQVCDSKGAEPITVGTPRFTVSPMNVSLAHERVNLFGNYLAGSGGTNAVKVNGRTLPAIDLVFWNGGGVGVRVPGAILAGEYQVTVTTGGGTSNPAIIHVLPSAEVPGATGSGWGAPLPGTGVSTPNTATSSTSSVIGTSTGNTIGTSTVRTSETSTVGTSTPKTSASVPAKSGASAKKATLTIAGPALLAAGGSGAYTADPVAKTHTVWASSNPAVLAVTPQGVATAKMPGVATLSAVRDGLGAEKTIKVTAAAATGAVKKGPAKHGGLLAGLGGVLGAGALLLGAVLLRRRRKKKQTAS